MGKNSTVIEPKQENQILETLHKVAKQILDVKEEQEFYQIISHAICEIIPDAYFIITALQPDDMNFRVVAMTDIDIKTIVEKVGFDPFTKDYPFIDMNHEQLEAFDCRVTFTSTTAELSVIL